MRAQGFGAEASEVDIYQPNRTGARERDAARSGDPGEKPSRGERPMISIKFFVAKQTLNSVGSLGLLHENDEAAGGRAVRIRYD